MDNQLDELNYVYTSDYRLSPSGHKIRQNRITFASQDDDVRRMEKKKHRDAALRRSKARKKMRKVYKTMMDYDEELTRKQEQELKDLRKRQKDRGVTSTVKPIKEASMTPAQIQKREEIVRAMKKRMKYYKDKYGADAEKVMYATATKTAMNETEQIMELSKDLLARYHKKASGEQWDAAKKSYIFKQMAKDEPNKKQAKEYSDVGKEAQKKHAKRLSGAYKAFTKLQKEETNMNEKLEQILEQIYDLNESDRADLFDMASQIEEELEIENGKEVVVESKSEQVVENRLSYKDFVTALQEGTKIPTSTGYIHKGSYGKAYDGDDDDDKPKSSEDQPKRKRGRQPGTTFRYKPRSAETNAAAAAKRAANRAAKRAADSN